MVNFQQQSTQRLINQYEHMNSGNDRLDLRLNPLQRENYFIKYEKSYVINCNYACFHSLQLFGLSLHNAVAAERPLDGLVKCFTYIVN